MLDPTERMLWFDAYLQEALRAAPKPIRQDTFRAIHAWARSMAAIAEQFADNDDYETAEAVDA